MKLIAPLILSVVFTAIGLGLGLVGGFWTGLARSANAPAPTTVQGTVESVGDPIKKSGRRRSTYILPVTYRFEVGGVEYRGGTVGRHQTLLASRLRRHEMERLRGTLTPGAPVTIAYEAGEPERSFIPVPSLDTRNERGFYVGSIIAAVLTLIGLVSVVSVARHPARPGGHDRSRTGAGAGAERDAAPAAD